MRRSLVGLLCLCLASSSHGFRWPWQGKRPVAPAPPQPLEEPSALSSTVALLQRQATSKTSLVLLSLTIFFSLNMHYVLCGGTVLEGLFASRPLVRLMNNVLRLTVRKKMSEQVERTAPLERALQLARVGPLPRELQPPLRRLAQGIPEPAKTIEYAPGLLMDVFEAPAASAAAPAPCVLYFHAGAFFSGCREFGAGTMA